MQQAFRLTLGDLRRLCPHGKRDILKGVVAHALVLEEYGLMRNRRRLCHFLAQAAHETAGFRTLVEYGSTSYFHRRYGSRRDLGNRQLSDGSRYRGRGIFQLTGRDNYRRYGRFLHIDLEGNPQLAKGAKTSLRIACEYWRRHDLNNFADRNDIRVITKRINGGYNGFKERRAYLQRAFSIWSPENSPPVERSVLRLGEHGLDVKNLQRRLRAQGYGLVVDGIFGPQTLSVLKAFQKAHHLIPDGLFGPRSKRQLHTSHFPPTQPKETYMDQWKSYFLSRTIWANLIGFTALALDVFGFHGFSSEDQSQLIDHLLKLIEAAGFIAGMVFRAIARDRLGPILF